jgi:hypothetical protein
MKSPAPRALFAGALCLVVAGLFWAECRSGNAGPDGSNRSGSPWGPAGEIERAEQLEEGRKVVLWCVGVKRTLTEEVIAGRRTLFEAAAGFRNAERIKVQRAPSLCAAGPDSTDEEHCRQVIQQVRRSLQGQPNQSAVVARLEEQLREELARKGIVRLPAPPGSENFPSFQ